MELYIVLAVVGTAVMAVVGYIAGRRQGGGNREDAGKMAALEAKVAELSGRNTTLENQIGNYINEVKELTAERDVQRSKAENATKQLEENRKQAEAFYEKQLAQVKETAEKQLEALREMNKKQVEAQLALIKEQMKATSETVLKARQEELGEKNVEQVSKIICLA